MISAKYSKMLAAKKQKALSNNDFEMVKKVERVKRDADITEDMIKY